MINPQNDYFFKLNFRKRKSVVVMARNEARKKISSDMGFRRDLGEGMQHEEQVN